MTQSAVGTTQPSPKMTAPSPGRIEPSLALYVHMPWCVRKCPYCDFNSHQLISAAPDAAYIDALIRDFDMELPRLAGRRIDTVFFGGGTPSLFQPEDFSRLLGALRRRIAFALDAEITMEANPGTIERGRFAGYRDAGINRVSLGAQSFARRSLEVLGRIHTALDTQRAVAELRAAKLDNFNLDLMYALPEQTLEQALEDVRTACALEPAHISYYQLTLEPGTVFHARPPRLPDEDAAWEMQTAGQKLLSDAGYVQYEVSAYARFGKRCRHNLNYWLFGDYVGIGAGAHGKLSLARPQRILRTHKPKQPREYQQQVRRASEHASNGGNGNGGARCGGLGAHHTVRSAIGAGSALSATRSVDGDGAGGDTVIGASSFVPPEDLPFEFMLNALRLNEGFAAQDYRQRTGLKMDSVQVELAAAERRGLLESRADGWRPTELGRRFLNDLQASFLA